MSLFFAENKKASMPEERQGKDKLTARGVV